MEHHFISPHNKSHIITVNNFSQKIGDRSVNLSQEKAIEQVTSGVIAQQGVENFQKRPKIQESHLQITELKKQISENHILGRVEKVFITFMISMLKGLGLRQELIDPFYLKLGRHEMAVGAVIDRKIYHSVNDIQSHRSWSEKGNNINEELKLAIIPDALFLNPAELDHPSLHDDDLNAQVTSQRAAVLGLHRSSASNRYSASIGIVEAEKIEDLGIMTPYAFRNKGKTVQLVPGEVTPTSSALKNINIAHEEHLANTYVLELEGDKAVIRSGKIDTKERADDFIAIILQLHNTYGKKMRVVSQQLNSFEKEAKIIKDQHNMVAYINSQLVGKAEVVHINTPSNGWFHATRWVESYPIIGKFVKFMFRTFYEKNSFKSEELSKNLNLEGWATYVDWLTEDIKNSIQDLPSDLITTQLLAQVNKLDESNLQKKRLQDNIKAGMEFLTRLKNSQPLDDKAKAFKMTVKSDLKLSQKELKEQLAIDVQIFKSIKEIITSSGITINRLANNDENSHSENDLVPSMVKEDLYINLDAKEYEDVFGDQEDVFGDLIEESVEIQEPLANVSPDYSPGFNLLPAESSILEKISLMSDVLESQLGKKELDRGQEGMAIQMLSDKLGVTCAMNCFSGLDRTGIWHAVKLAMLTMEKKMSPVKTLELVKNWEKTTTLMNQLTAHMEEGEHLGQLFPSFSELDQDGNVIRKLTPEGYDLIDFNQYHVLRKRYGDLFPQMTIPEFTKLKENMLAVIEFRNEVLKQLITVGIPLTTISTGVMGLKWSSGIRENLIPLNFLPSHVQNENGDVVPLTKFNKKGGVEQMTKEGSLLLKKYQDLRKH